MDQTYDDEMTKVDRPLTEIERAQMDLQKESAQLAEIVSEMARRLRPVLRQEPEADVEEGAEAAGRLDQALTTQSFSTPLAVNVAETTGRLRRTRRQIEKLIGNLEV